MVTAVTQMAPAAQAQAASMGQPGPKLARYSFPSVGLTPGQTIRVTVANHHRGASNPPEPDRIRIVLLDAAGQIAADSGEQLLPAVQSQSFDVQREKLDRSGEPGTGRVQLRAVVTIKSATSLSADPCRPGIEVLTTATGQTTLLAPPPVPEFSWGTRN
jgi:hypothetical protein